MFTKEQLTEAVNTLPIDSEIDWLGHEEGYDNIVFSIALVGEERPRLIVINKVLPTP